MRRLLPLCLCLALAACGGGSKQPHRARSMNDFNPAKGASFHLAVRDYELGRLGLAVPAADAGQGTELEEEAIRMLEDLGYRYEPGGRPDYAVRGQFLCMNPRQEARLEESGLPSPPFNDPFLAWTPATYVWEPGLPAEANAPESCAGRLQILIQPLGGAAQKPFGEQYSAGPCPFGLACPTAQCRPALRALFLQSLRDAFVQD